MVKISKLLIGSRSQTHFPSHPLQISKQAEVISQNFFFIYYHNMKVGFPSSLVCDSNQRTFHFKWDTEILEHLFDFFHSFTVIGRPPLYNLVFKS